MKLITVNANMIIKQVHLCGFILDQSKQKVKKSINKYIEPIINLYLILHIIQASKSKRRKKKQNANKGVNIPKFECKINLENFEEFASLEGTIIRVPNTYHVKHSFRFFFAVNII